MVTYNYATKVNVRQTDTTNSGTTIWSMTNSNESTRIITIEEINLNLGFHGITPLAATTLIYCIKMFNTAIPTGGITQTPEPMSSTNPSSGATDVRASDTGLTVTNVNFRSDFLTIGIPAVKGSNVFFRKNTVEIKLHPGEGLAIQLATDAIVGLSITGEIAWSER